MTGAVMPRRSLLFCPGSNPRAMHKAVTLPADVVIFDLEDAVAPQSKSDARSAVAEALAHAPHQQRAVRINGLDTPWGEDDLRMAIASTASAIVLPKVESQRAVTDIIQRFDAFSHPLWCMIETPRGVINARKIAKAPGVAVLIAGANDLSNALRIPSTPGRPALQLALQTIVLAARAYGLEVFDSVYADFADAQGFAKECAQGRILGFDGKTLIHPGQIATANTTFSPTEAEVANAQKVVDAWVVAEREHKGVAVVDGRMIEALHVSDAHRTLALQAAVTRRI